MNADLAVVIVSYNTAPLLRCCLRSLQTSLARSPDVTAQVVVADNASRDESPSVVAREFPSVRLLQLGDNRGFGAANNLAVRETSSTYILFLNPDTEVLGDAPGALLRFMARRPDVGLAGARLLNPDLSFQHSCFRFPTLAMTFLDFFPIHHRIANGWINGRYPRRCYERPFRIDHPLGACMLVRRDVFDRVGGFDESFFMYSEEVDLCYRIAQAGWQIWYCPDAEIVHHQGASARQSPGPMLLELHRSRDRFYRRHRGELYAWLGRQIVRLGMAAATRRARHEWRLGYLSETELERRIVLYREVAVG